MRAEDAAGYCPGDGRAAWAPTGLWSSFADSRWWLMHWEFCAERGGMRQSSHPARILARLLRALRRWRWTLNLVWGRCAALASTAVSRAVFAPVDQPLLPAGLVERCAHYQQCHDTYFSHRFTQTFPAVLDRGFLPALQCELHAGRRGCFSAFEAAAPAWGRGRAWLQPSRLLKPGGLCIPRSCPRHAGS